MVDWMSSLIGSNLTLPQSVFSNALLWLAELNEAELEPLVLASVLLSLIVVYLSAKLGGELCARINLPPVLGELVGGVVVGVSALHLIVFPEASGASRRLTANQVG
jgi:hypothetical protein